MDGCVNIYIYIGQGHVLQNKVVPMKWNKAWGGKVKCNRMELLIKFREGISNKN